MSSPSETRATSGAVAPRVATTAPRVVASVRAGTYGAGRVMADMVGPPSAWGTRELRGNDLRIRTIVIRASIWWSVRGPSERALSRLPRLARGRCRHATAGRPALGVRRAHRVEQAHQRLHLVLGERPDGGRVARVHERVQFVEQPLAAGSGVADHLAPVGERALAAHEPRFLQLVEQPGDRGPLLQHALANGERGNAPRPRAADDAEGVVLRKAQPERLDDALEHPTHYRRGPQQR